MFCKLCQQCHIVEGTSHIGIIFLRFSNAFILLNLSAYMRERVIVVTLLFCCSAQHFENGKNLSSLNGYCLEVNRKLSRFGGVFFGERKPDT